MLDTIILGFHLVSYHDTNEPRNNYNPGVYAIHTESGLVGGAYRNSYNRTSLYVGYSKAWSVGQWEISATGSVATGYQNRPYEAEGFDCPPEWQPRCYYNNGMSKHKLNFLFAPSVATPWIENKRLRLSFVPPVKSSETVLHLSVEFKL